MNFGMHRRNWKRNAPAMAGGGEIDGPMGDDQVAAAFSDGRPARLEDGEVVLPKEFVHQLGVAQIRKAVEAVTGKKMDPTVKEPLAGQTGGVLSAANGMEAQLKWENPNDVSLRNRGRFRPKAEVLVEKEAIRSANASKAARFAADTMYEGTINIPGGKPPPTNQMPVVYEEPWVGKSSQRPIIPARTSLAPYAPGGRDLVPVPPAPAGPRASRVAQPNAFMIDLGAASNAFSRSQKIASRMRETGENWQQAAKQIPHEGSTDVFGIQAMGGQPVVDPITGAARALRGLGSAVAESPIGKAVSQFPGSMTVERWNARRPGNKTVPKPAEEETAARKVAALTPPQMSPTPARQPQTEQQMLDRLAPAGASITRDGQVFRMEDKGVAAEAAMMRQADRGRAEIGQFIQPGVPVSGWVAKPTGGRGVNGWEMDTASLRAESPEWKAAHRMTGQNSGVTFSDTVEGLGLGQKTPPAADAQTMEELRGLYKSKGAEQRKMFETRGLDGQQVELSAPAVTREERAQNLQMRNALTARDQMMQEAAAALKPSEVLAAQRFEYDKGRNAAADTRQSRLDREKKREYFLSDKSPTPPLGLDRAIYWGLIDEFSQAGLPEDDVITYLNSINDPKLEKALMKGELVSGNDGKMLTPLEMLKARVAAALRQQQ